MVTSPHTLASEAGLAVLEEGGNAIEAAIATAAAIAVTYPHFCGLGGDAVWIVADREGRADTFLGIGQAAGVLPDLADTIPLRGPGSALTTACALDSWNTAFAYARDHWSGQRSFASLLDRAIALAEGGFPTTPSQVFWHDFRKAEIGGWPGFAGLFEPGGRAPAIGERFVQPALAGSLRAIARNGPRDFYEGELAARISEGLSRAGSPITADDLARTATRQEAPLRLDYRDVTLLAPPPPTQGVSTLSIMGTLRAFAMDQVSEGSADFYHLCVEAVKQSFLERHRIADPDASDQPTARWLSDAVLADQAAAIDPQAALPWPQPFRAGDTVYIGAADAAGRSASLLQSIFYDWGSGVVAGDTGILWQNRGGAFSLDPASVNVLAPGKRPFYTLNPGIALKDGRPCLLYGTQGADGQPQTLSVVLSRLIDHGLDPHEALARPRFLLGRTFSDNRDSLKIESDVSEAVRSALAARGHAIAPIPPCNPLAGQAGVIAIAADGSMRGAHDPRSDGQALGVDDS
ncbi:MAG: gamma-glutamyltransferase [Microvirga sp.]